MATTDRYVFAKVDGTGWYASDVTDIPAPDPADWQTIVEAFTNYDQHEGNPTDVVRAVRAAVRNMEARS